MKTHLMNKEIQALQPSLLWKNFNSICDIPHPSKHEAKIIAWVQDFAKLNGLQYKTDETGNTVILKPATKGMENRRTVVLQSHLDMVPQKNQNVQHDFEKDPIRLQIVDGWVKAVDTTLGADNGIGAAAMLAVLESKDLAHGPIEALFTTDEETGLTGAFGLKPGFVTGDILLNTDTEDEGHFCIGCAGGINTNATLSLKRMPLSDDHVFFRIGIKGLKGGHSGCDIHLYRANANKLMARLLKTAASDAALRIVSLEGGNVRNAIPREAFAVVAVPGSRIKDLENALARFAKEIRNEYAIAEPDFEVGIEPSEPAEALDLSSQDTLLNLLYALPNGVIRMSDEVKGIVETSTNLSVVRVAGSKAEIQLLTRSSVGTAKDDVTRTLQCIFDLAGAAAVHEGAYPGWKPDAHSKVLTLMKDIYRKRFGMEAQVEVVHAGLECGIIGSIYPGMDMISFGPTIRFPHSPDEKVEIVSVQKFWDLLTDVLKNIPAV